MIQLKREPKTRIYHKPDECRGKRNRVGIPVDPCEYERRRLLAQQVVDRYHGSRRYRVVGKPGEMLQLVKWVDYPLLPAAQINHEVPRTAVASMRSSAAA